MAGTALIQVIDRRPMRSQKPLRWKRSSRTRLEPATNADSKPTTSALMWNSGSGLKPRSSGPSSRCDATLAAVCSSLSWPNRTTLGVPVVPDDDRTTPPAPARCGAVAPGRVHVSVLEVLEAVELHPRRVDAGRGRPIRHHHIHARARQGGCQATLAGHRHGRVERRHPESGAHGTEEGVGERHRVADDEADGGEATGADPSEQGPPPLHAAPPAGGRTASLPSRACST